MTPSIPSESDRPAILVQLERQRRAAIRSAFSRLDPLALGLASGVTSGLTVLAITIRAVAAEQEQPGARIGEMVGLLWHYLPGFSYTYGGAALGAASAAAAGFLLAFSAAVFRNWALGLVLWKAKWDAMAWRRRHMLDEIA